MRKMTVCPRSWKCLSLRSRTVCPRCRSGAVGSKPAFTRSGLPDASERSSFARSSDSLTISAAPCLMYASCSSTGEKFAMRSDYNDPLHLPGLYREIQFKNCHPERSEGSAVRSKMQIPRFARDDKILEGGGSLYQPPIKAQGRVSLHQLPIAPQFCKRLSRIKSLLMLCDHQAPRPQQFRFGQSLQRPCVLVSHRVGGTEKDEIRDAPNRLQLAHGLRGFGPYDLEPSHNPQRLQVSGDQIRRRFGRLDEVHHARAAAQCFNADRARPRIQIQPRRLSQRRRIARAKNIEQRLAQPVRRGTDLEPR